MLAKPDEIQALRKGLAQLDKYACQHSEDPAALAWIERHLDELDLRLTRVENSLLFRAARSIGGLASRSKRKLGRLLLRSPLHSVYRRAQATPGHVLLYRRWAAAQQASEPPIAQCQERMKTWTYRPVISILVPAHNPRREWFEAAIKSVLGQVYPNWQLLIHDDASSGTWLADYCAGQGRVEPRIHYSASSKLAGISGALNSASEKATGDYIGFLDHDDVLSPLALYRVVEALQGADLPDVLYTDEDTIDEAAQPLRPNFKPDWSPELLNSCMYMGHFFVVRRARFLEAGRFRADYDGAQDFDLALRITESGGKAVHIPYVLYHWREHAASTAQRADAKPYAREAGRRALESAVLRRGWKASVSHGSLPNQFIVYRQIQRSPLVSIVICTRSSRMIRNCLKAISKNTDYSRREIVVVHHEVGTPAENQAVRGIIEDAGCRRVPYSSAFNFATMNNLGAEAAAGEILVLLNDDTEPLSANWLSTMVSHLERTEIGAVGARLVYPNGPLQHAGIVLGIGEGTGHPGRHLFASDFWRWLDYTRNVSAVTAACIGVRREIFLQLGGFDAAFPVNYNDVDFCLRMRAAGYEVIYDHTVVLRHHECQTRRAGTRPQERRAFFRRWGHLLTHPDPYYSRHLDAETEEATINL